MLHILGNDILRDGQRVGYLKNGAIFSHEGQKLGYIRDGHEIMRSDGQKLAWTEGNRVKTMDGKNMKIGDINNQVFGGELSNEHRAAIHFFLGSD